MSKELNTSAIYEIDAFPAFAALQRTQTALCNSLYSKKAYFFHQLVITCVSAFISTRTAYPYAQIHTCNSINTHPVAVVVCLANTWASATHETEDELHGKQLYTLNVGWTTHTSTHRDDNKLKRHKEQQKKKNRVQMCVTVEKIWWHQVNNHQRITFWSLK